MPFYKMITALYIKEPLEHVEGYNVSMSRVSQRCSETEDIIFLTNVLNNRIPINNEYFHQMAEEKIVLRSSDSMISRFKLIWEHLNNYNISAILHIIQNFSQKDIRCMVFIQDSSVAKPECAQDPRTLPSHNRKIS